jgi:hypothetical protein
MLIPTGILSFKKVIIYKMISRLLAVTLQKHFCSVTVDSDRMELYVLLFMIAIISGKIQSLGYLI